MATVSISDSNNRVEDMETSPTIADIGAGAGGGTETVTYFQATQSISRKITNAAARGTGTSVTAVNMTTGDNQVWLSKTFLSDYQDVNTVGWFLRIGSSASNYNEYVLIDNGSLGDRDANDFPRGGWIIEAIDPNRTEWPELIVSSPTITAITHFQVGAGLATGAAKSENIFIDSVDLGDGLYLVGGDGADADGTWDDFVADDQGTLTAGRFGHFVTNASGIEVRGKAIRGRTSAGTVTATVFTDSLQSITWPGGRVSAGWNELEDDLGNASTVISESSSTFSGGGRSEYEFWFDTDHDIAGNVIGDLSWEHGFQTGDAVLYTNEGGTETPGPTNNTIYWVRALSANTLTLHSVQRFSAYQNSNIVTLTASTSGNGESHKLTRQPDTRPDYTATGTSGSATYTNCNFIRFRDFNPTSAVSFNSCNIVGCRTMILNGATLTDSNVSDAVLGEGASAVETSDLADISGCTFNSSTSYSTARPGHAIEIDTAGTYSFSNNTFNDYWTHSGGAGDGAEFGTTSGVASGTDIITTDAAHGFTTGDPVYYNDNGGAVSIGLTDGNRYYVRVLSTTTLTLHNTRLAADDNLDIINLTASGAETHTLYSANAAILNISNGLVTINVSGGNTPYVRNTGTGTATVNNTVSFTVSGVQPDSEVRIYDKSDTTIELAGSESVAGSLQSFSIISGGTGYSVSDVLTLSGGTFTTAAQITVTAVSSGVITAANITTAGSYTVPPDTPASLTGGTGSGATINPVITGSLTYQYNYSVDTPIVVVVFHLDFKDLRLTTLSLLNSNQSIPVNQIVDRVYENP